MKIAVLQEHADLISEAVRRWYQKKLRENRGALPFDFDDAHQEAWVALLLSEDGDADLGPNVPRIVSLVSWRLSDWARLELGSFRPAWAAGK